MAFYHFFRANVADVAKHLWSVCGQTINIRFKERFLKYAKFIIPVFTFMNMRKHHGSRRNERYMYLYEHIIPMERSQYQNSRKLVAITTIVRLQSLRHRALLHTTILVRMCYCFCNYPTNLLMTYPVSYLRIYRANQPVPSPIPDSLRFF